MRLGERGDNRALSNTKKRHRAQSLRPMPVPGNSIITIVKILFFFANHPDEIQLFIVALFYGVASKA